MLVSVDEIEGVGVLDARARESLEGSTIHFLFGTQVAIFTSLEIRDLRDHAYLLAFRLNNLAVWVDLCWPLLLIRKVKLYSLAFFVDAVEGELARLIEAAVTASQCRAHLFARCESARTRVHTMKCEGRYKMTRLWSFVRPWFNLCKINFTRE